MLAMFQLVFRIRFDRLNFLVKRLWGQNVSLYIVLYCKTLKLFIHFLVSISISRDKASVFFDIKILTSCSSVTYMYLK